MSVSVWVCRYIRKPEEDVRFSGIGGMGGFELPDMDSRKQTWRVESVLTTEHPSSPRRVRTKQAELHVPLRTVPSGSKDSTRYFML